MVSRQTREVCHHFQHFRLQHRALPPAAGGGHGQQELTDLCLNLHGGPRATHGDQLGASRGTSSSPSL